MVEPRRMLDDNPSALFASLAVAATAERAPEAVRARVMEVALGSAVLLAAASGGAAIGTGAAASAVVSTAGSAAVSTGASAGTALAGTAAIGAGMGTAGAGAAAGGGFLGSAVGGFFSAQWATAAVLVKWGVVVAASGAGVLAVDHVVNRPAVSVVAPAERTNHGAAPASEKYVSPKQVSIPRVSSQAPLVLPVAEELVAPSQAKIEPSEAERTGPPHPEAARTTPRLAAARVRSLPRRVTPCSSSGCGPVRNGAAEAGLKKQSPPQAATFADELQLLSEARRALRALQPSRVVALADRHAELFPKGQLSSEFRLLRARAESQAGEE